MYIYIYIHIYIYNREREICLYFYLKASPHAADSKISKTHSQYVSQKNKNEAKREPKRAKVPSKTPMRLKSIEKGCQQKETKKISKMTKLEPKAKPKRANLQRPPCGTGSHKVSKKDAKRRKPVFQQHSDFYGFCPHPDLKILRHTMVRTHSFLK